MKKYLKITIMTIMIFMIALLLKSIQAQTNTQATDSIMTPVVGQSVSYEKFSLYEWFVRGGIFMWPILIFSAFGMGLAIERGIFFFRAKLNSNKFKIELQNRLNNDTAENLIEFCASAENKSAQIISRGLRNKHLGFEHAERSIDAIGSIEVASLEKGLSILNAIGNITPLLGFLGTVSGMIGAFQSIAAADQVSAKLVANGIYEALITTEAGLISAIPLIAVYNYYIHKIENFVADTEKIASDILEKVF